ncbi:MAG: hypothetical protein IPI03_19455 [Rubrivivax sp.]|jgi:hypothetical protein|nr:hypothetical protein [Rubrivivax sp.]MBK7263907.1 hypothetical protein [Rubrivivax sp.]MBK8525813.1 hypothetical protein [Rubrivivax sp.]
MAMTEGHATTPFARLEAEKVNVFYVKAPVEFGTVGATGTRWLHLHWAGMALHEWRRSAPGT